jgi:anti-sigma factor RsiW
MNINNFTCRDAHEYLMAYLDNELPDVERAAFDSHLAECGSCRRYLEQYAVVVAQARAAGKDPRDVDSVVPVGLMSMIRNTRRELPTM